MLRTKTLLNSTIIFVLMRIVHNISSMTTQSSLYKVGRDVKTSLERLSTGLRNLLGISNSCSKKSMETINPYMIYDKVTYTDASSWPKEADGQGMSLQKTESGAYGNDPANWKAGKPSSGK